MALAAAGVWMLDAGGWALALAAAMALGAAVVALLGAARWALGFGGPMLGVARAVIEEAVRLKVAVVFIALLVIVLPLLPAAIGADQPLRYRVQSFLAYAMGLSGFLLSLMTLLLACATLSGEVEQKQIFTTAVKPIARWMYLLGKWLGLAALNALLAAAAGATIWLLATQHLARQPAHNDYDRGALDQEVLIARRAVDPAPAQPLSRRVEARLKQLAESEPGALVELGRLEAADLGLGPITDAERMRLGAVRAERQIAEETLVQWLTIAPGRSQTYVFDGLPAAAAGGGFVQLQYKLRANVQLPGDEAPVTLRINGRERRVNLVLDARQALPIPAELIGPEGRLELTVVNHAPQDATITFMSVSDVRVFHAVGSFEANLARGMAAMWIKLLFLTAAGLAAASFAGFPVAALTAGAVWLIADVSGFMVESFQYAARSAEGEVARRLIDAGQALVGLFSAYARFDPTRAIAEGRVFGWEELAACAGWIGVGWTAAALGAGMAIFSRRELARVQV
jgi:hypothetical protein